MACALALCAPVVAAPEDIATVPADTGRSLGGFVIPVQPRDGDISLQALRSWRWSHGGTKRLLLEGDVVLQLDTWRFESNRALLWIDRVNTTSGPVTQVAAFLPQTRPGTQASTGWARGRNLLIVATFRGDTTLDCALATEGPPPPGTPILAAGEARLAAYVASVRHDPPRLALHPTAVPPEAPPADQGDLPLTGTLARGSSAPWLRQAGATIGFSADEVVISGGDEHATVVADGAVAIDYKPVGGSDELGRLRLTAERAVIFITPGSLEDLAGRDLSAEDVKGVYLEGAVTAVAERDEYEVRAPRMYYDFATDRAIMVDAVLRTYDRKTRSPVVARAGELRQLARHEWTMSNASLSASSFATPTLALAADTARLIRQPATIDAQGQGVDATVVMESTGNSIQLDGTPIFYWPHFKGSPGDVPIEGVRAGWQRYRGVYVETTWDVYALLGMVPSQGEELELELDGWSARGVGAGITWSQDTLDTVSRLRLYGLLDSGTQRTDANVEQPVPTHHRWEALWESTTALSPEWTVQTQVSSFSDSTFVSAWRQEAFRNHREYETSAFLRWQDENAEFSLLAKYDLNNFVSNSWLMGSQGFTLDEFPRAALRFFGADLFERATWTSEWIFSRFRANIPDGTAFDNGAPVTAFIDPITGMPIGAGDPIAMAINNANIHGDWAMRGISSHHLAVPLQYGPVSVTPFAHAQFQSFLQQEANMPADADSTRLIGGAGVTVSTSLQRIWNDVEHRVLDLHRLRAVVEPSVTAWWADSTFDPGNVAENPQYDPWIDGTSRGGAVRFAVRSTLQTMRGGPGQWFDVDWLKAEFGAVIAHDESARRYPTPQWFQSNPLYSQLGTFADGRVRWQVGEGLVAMSEGVWDFDAEQFARGMIGVQLTHTPRFMTAVEFRHIEVPDAFVAANGIIAADAARGQLLTMAAQYEVGDLYNVRIRPTWNFAENDWQYLRADVTRAFPDFDLDIYVRYDRINGETTAGVSIGQRHF